MQIVRHRFPMAEANGTRNMADAFTPSSPKLVPPPRDPHLREMANCIRFLAMDAVQQAKSGHPGAPLGMADIASVLFKGFMQFDDRTSNAG